MHRYLRRRLKERWERLTDGELEEVDGQVAHLLGLLQQKYGYERHHAERELVAFFDEFLLRQRKLPQIAGIESEHRGRNGSAGGTSAGLP